jgi:hypothetical protein
LNGLLAVELNELAERQRLSDSSEWKSNNVRKAA